MRYFNTHGPVNDTEHYVVPRNELITDLVAEIERGKYFTIYAPRQMGKTTLLRRLHEILSLKPDYVPLSFSFEAFEAWSESDFLAEFGEWLGTEISAGLPHSHPNSKAVQALLTNSPPVDYRSLWRFSKKLQELVPDLKIVMIIDEFDATPQEAISHLLQTWRQIYLANTPPRTLQSIILIGLQNMATLNLDRSSPFNIARQLQLSGFTLDEVENLLAQYTTETGQSFTSGALSQIHHQTAGQPFLVNRLATILTKEIATNQEQPITLPDLDKALRQLVKERHYNFETIARHARTFEEEVLQILFGKLYPFNFNDPLVHTLQMHGIISQTKAGYCQIANPIYSKVLTAYFRPRELALQGDILANGYDFRTHQVGNELQMDRLLSRFREFIERRGREAFTVTPMPQEATGQYLLMAYLDLVVRQLGGDPSFVRTSLFIEVDSGEGRLDLIVVYRGHRYIIETKIWYGQVLYRGAAAIGQLFRERGANNWLLCCFSRPSEGLWEADI